jgi:hypothetical protein
MEKEFLTGKIIDLKSLEESDFKNIFQWLSDQDITNLLYIN